MGFLCNIKVGCKLALLLAVLLTANAAIFAYGLYSMREINKEAEKMYQTDMLGLIETQKIMVSVSEATRTLRNSALSVDRPYHEQYRKSHTQYIQDALSAFQNVEKKAISDQSLAQLRMAKEAMQKAAQAQDSSFTYFMSTNSSKREALQQLIAIRPLEEKAQAAVTDFAHGMVEEAKISSGHISETYGRGLGIGAMLFLCTCAVSIIFGYMIARAIATPLGQVTAQANLVAQGDLKQHFAYGSKDEIGQLASSLEQMVDHLRVRITEAEEREQEVERQNSRIMEAMQAATLARETAEARQTTLQSMAEQVSVIVNHLSSTSQQLSEQIGQASGSARAQQDRVASSTAAMQEMNAKVIEVAQNASSAAERSNTARGKAVEGSSVVEDSIHALEIVQANTDGLRAEMEGLGKQAEAIGAVMTVINDIADQTNLLALNAAIEAARAGDAGRGFAVVADEVRKLAENTMNATKEVGATIHGIQQSTQRSIDAMGETSSNLHEAAERAASSGKVLGDIVHETDQAADQVRHIAAAAGMQSAAANEVHTSMDEINTMAGNTVTSMAYSAKAVEELARQTEELLGIVRNLRSSS